MGRRSAVEVRHIAQRCARSWRGAHFRRLRLQPKAAWPPAGNASRGQLHVEPAQDARCGPTNAGRRDRATTHLTLLLAAAPRAAGVPLQCSVLLTRHPGLLAEANSSSAEYLFHPHAHASYDIGDRTLQCGRRGDAMKLWLAWLFGGTEAFAARVEHAFQLAREMATSVRKRQPALQLVVPPLGAPNICFWYIPTKWRDLVAANPCATVTEALQTLQDDQRWGAAAKDVGAITLAIYGRLQRRGRALVNFNPLPDQNLPHFFRAVVSHPCLEARDLDAVLDEILAAAAEVDDSAP